MLQLALFLGVITAATIMDFYFDENAIEIAAEAESGQTADEQAAIYLFSQTGNATAKTFIQKNQNRKLFVEHDKFLQRYHESKSFEKLKTKEKEPVTPLFLTFYCLLFRNHYFTVPDDDAYLS
ncbi:MAG: hypothetical protein ACOCVA_03870 [Prolixibacteraceae bacterium]